MGTPIEDTSISETELSTGWADANPELFLQAVVEFHENHPDDVWERTVDFARGGSPVADRAWRGKVEAKGATVEEHRPEKPPVRIGRPSRLDPDKATAERLRSGCGASGQTRRVRWRIVCRPCATFSATTYPGKRFTCALERRTNLNEEPS